MQARLEISNETAFLEAVTAFIEACAKRYGLPPARLEKLKGAAQAALTLVATSHHEGNTEAPIAVTLAHEEGSLMIEILNKGLPLAALPGQNNAGVDCLRIENEGRLGQTITLEMRLPPSPMRQQALSQSAARRQIAPKDEEIAIRELGPKEETALSQLFYFVYGYNYINELLYYPEKIRAMIEQKKLLSTVAALSNGRILGHVGLVKKNEAPSVYEAAMGAVDPLVKSRGLFSKIFDAVMKQMAATPMHYCVFDFVTNHALSQKTIAPYGTCEMALFVGCQSSITQAKLEKLGLGPDPEDMNRYSILLSIIPRIRQPFGAEVLLPESIGETLGFLLKPLGLDWVPTPRFYPLPPGGQYQINCQPTQGAVVFDLFEPGRKAVEAILTHWSELLRDGYEYAAIEVPLELPGLGDLHQMLAEHGFFVAGFIPYRLSARLGFRFQAIGHARVAFDKVRMATESGKKLLGVVSKECEANILV